MPKNNHSKPAQQLGFLILFFLIRESLSKWYSWGLEGIPINPRFTGLLVQGEGPRMWHSLDLWYSYADLVHPSTVWDSHASVQGITGLDLAMLRSPCGRVGLPQL